MNVVAKIGIIGDMHLCSKNYGAHTDYPKESLEYFKKVSDLTEQLGLTHLIGSGDLTYGRFDKLEYREAVEQELLRQFNATNGNRFELLGNHDTATNGMTEYEYYTRRGLIKTSQNFSINNLNITMLDYKKSGKYKNEDMNIKLGDNNINLVIAHQYFKYEKTQMPNFGDAIILDDYDQMFGADYLICGHVHHQFLFDGVIKKLDAEHKCNVHYVGCMMRPAYREGHMDDIGQMAVITLMDDGSIEYKIHEIEIWSLDKSFNIEEKMIENEKKQEKENRVDISDIVKQLDSHERNIGNPEDIINSMVGIDEKYKNKAIDLLKKAM